MFEKACAGSMRSKLLAPMSCAALLATAATLPLDCAHASSPAFPNSGPAIDIPESWARPADMRSRPIRPMATAGSKSSVTISSASTANITCSAAPVTCTPTASGAVLNVTQLQTLLAKNNVKINTGSGSGTDAGDIDIESALTWASTHGLTLDARHSIKIDAHVSVTGAGGLTLITDDGGSSGSFSFGTNGNITFLGLTNVLTINHKVYKLENNIASLASDIAANPSGYFALAASYDATTDGIYKKPPIAEFNGYFEGLGNTISNLEITMKAPATNLEPDDPWSGEVGLFAFVDAEGFVENIGLLKAT